MPPVPALSRSNLPSVRDQFVAVRAYALGEANARVVAIAKLANAAIMNLDPKPAAFIRTVDGLRGAPEERVKPNGIIVYEYERFEIAVDAAMQILREKSPVLTGLYREAHAIYVNGAAVTGAIPTMRATDDIIITNLEPYARKIEVGHMRMRVPGTDHVYEQARQILNSRFGNQMLVDLEFRPAPGGQALQGRFAKGFRPQARKRLAKDTRAGAQLTFPTLVFKAL